MLDAGDQLELDARCWMLYAGAGAGAVAIAIAETGRGGGGGCDGGYIRLYISFS